MIKEDLPEPLTPVTTVRQPFGMSTEMSLRLFALAFEIVICRAGLGSLLCGIGILCR